VTVIVWAALLVLMVVDAKAKLGGLRINEPTPIPLPLSDTD
jgi:hypothetical protein